MVTAEPVEPALVGITYACKRLGISRSHAHTLVHRGEFPVRVVKVGSRFRVNRQELEDFIAGRGPAEEGQAISQA